MIPVAEGWGVVKPDHTYHDLDKGAQKHQKKLQVQAPPFMVDACGDLSFKNQKNSVGFHEDAGNAKDKTDPKSRLA